MVSFDEAAFGGEKLIHIGAQDGSGQVQSLQVHIPAGIEDGKSIRLRGKGHAGHEWRRIGRPAFEGSCGDKGWI